MNPYSETIIDLAKHPLNRGEMEDATHTASGVNLTCGDHVRIYLKVERNEIEEATWEGEGCAISTASASILTEELKGKSLEEMKAFSKDELFELLELEGLGPARVKCVTLALETAQKLND